MTSSCPTHRRRSRRRQGGFSLIEALVSILIFSLGVLSLISLQATSIRQSSNAKYRSEASLLTNQLIGEMWMTDRAGTTLQTEFNTGGAGYTTWLGRVQAVLPVSAASAPSVTVTADGQVAVNIYWKAPNEQPSVPMHRFTAVAQVK